jgi:hypothetical protein
MRRIQVLRQVDPEVAAVVVVKRPAAQQALEAQQDLF